MQPLLPDQGDNFLRSGSLRRSLSLVPEEQELARPPLRRTSSVMGDDVEGRAHFRSLLLGELNRIANFYDQKVMLGHITQHAAAVPYSGQIVDAQAVALLLQEREVLAQVSLVTEKIRSAEIPGGHRCWLLAAGCCPSSPASCMLPSRQGSNSANTRCHA